MVMKYIILANSNDKTFNIPRQLVEINGERLIERTIRLLKENGVSDIIITASDKRFDGLGAERYEPKNSNYDYATGKGYWLNAFPFELMNEPICFIWGDVYFSEEAIKTIVNTETDSMLFFCTYNNTSPLYIKHHDEPLAYKVVDTDLFKEHITRVKEMKDKGLCCREPIVWEVYRSIHGQDINTHEMTTDFVAINDISCDIDSVKDAEEIEYQIRRDNMIKCEVIKEFTLEKFDELKNIKRKRIDTKGKLYEGDTFECTEEMYKYLTGTNEKGAIVVKVIEVMPKKEEVDITENEFEIRSEEVKELVDERIQEAEEIIKPKSKKKKSSKK